MNWLKALYAEQTTPDEVVIFLLLGTFITLVIAFFFYVLVLLVLSSVRMKGPHSLRELLFPSGARIRKYAAEYVMGILTAVLLSLTVMAKHDVVETVLAQDISSIGYETVLEALPNGKLTQDELEDAGASPENAKMIADWLENGAVKPATMRADSLIRPLLEAGMTDNANLIVRAIVENLPIAADSLMLQIILLVAAVTLLLGYVIWFGLQRWKEMQKERAGEPAYASILKRLSLPAVCIPLLFVSAVALEDASRIVDSAVAAAAITALPEESPFSEAVEKQAESPDPGVSAEDLDAVNASMQQLDTELAQIARNIATLETRLASSMQSTRVTIDRLEETTSQLRRAADERTRQVDADIAGLRQDLEISLQRLNQQMERFAEVAEQALNLARSDSGRIDEIENALSQLQLEIRRLAQVMAQQGSTTGLLLVQNANSGGRYQVRRGSANGAIVDSGVGLGLHVLPAGRYVITGDASRSANQVIDADEAGTVRLQRAFATID